MTTTETKNIAIIDSYFKAIQTGDLQTLGYWSLRILFGINQAATSSQERTKVHQQYLGRLGA